MDQKERICTSKVIIIQTMVTLYTVTMVKGPNRIKTLKSTGSPVYSSFIYGPVLESDMQTIQKWPFFSLSQKTRNVLIRTQKKCQFFFSIFSCNKIFILSFLDLRLIPDNQLQRGSAWRSLGKTRT